MNYIEHSGVKDMKWGVRRYQNYDGSLTPLGRIHYGVGVNKRQGFVKQNTKKIITNADGSRTVPKGYKFNRVGKGNQQFDVNRAGALYVSHGKDDAARFIKVYAPTLAGKINGSAKDTIYHITSVGEIKMPSIKQMAKLASDTLRNNTSLMKAFKKSGYLDEFNQTKHGKITDETFEKASRNPESYTAKSLLFSFSRMFGDGRYGEQVKIFYDALRDSGYDAIPDLNDNWRGIADTATIVINPEKLKIESTTKLTREIVKEAKDWVKSNPAFSVRVIK